MPGITFDPSADFLLTDFLDTFTLKVQGQADVVLTESVLTEPIATKEMENSDGQVPQKDLMAVWPISLSPTQPPLGSVLVDSDGVYWTILAIVRKQHVETWEARCRNLSIIAASTNRVTLLKGSYGKSWANEAKVTWHGLVSGQSPPTAADTMAVRLQPAMELAQIRYGAEWSRQTYRMIMQERLDIDLAGGEYRVQDEAGNRYRIIEVFDECRLDRYPIAMVVRIVEGREYFRHDTPGPLPPPSFPEP